MKRLETDARAAEERRKKDLLLQKMKELDTGAGLLFCLYERFRLVFKSFNMSSQPHARSKRQKAHGVTSHINRISLLANVQTMFNLGI